MKWPFPAVIPTLIVLWVHLIFMTVYPAYYYWNGTDVLMHTAGGAAMACIAWSIWPQKTDWRRFLAMLGFVALIGIFWEWYEFLSDQLVGTLTQPGLADTMADFLCDLLGASAVLIGIYVVERSKR